jgi:hypothetical protein
VLFRAIVFELRFICFVRAMLSFIVTRASQTGGVKIGGHFQFLYRAGSYSSRSEFVELELKFQDRKMRTGKPYTVFNPP